VTGISSSSSRTYREAVVKQLLFVLLIVVAGVVGISALPSSTRAVHELPTVWPPLSPTCYDVNGDGQVDLANDILGVITKFNTKWGDDDYSLLYDVSGGGVIDLANDILRTIMAFNPIPPSTCSFIDIQATLATTATMKYQDPSVALAEGYTWGSQYIGNMGIHLYKESILTDFPTFYDGSPENLALPPEEQNHQLTRPFGLVYSDAGNNQPDVLIGLWYVVPTPDVCAFHAVTGPCQDISLEPAGFGTTNTDEDNIGDAWHTHTGLCVRDWDTVSAAVTGEFTSEGSCLSQSDYWFSTYGWMMHFYNFVPNPDGRFEKWNSNPDVPQCGYEPPQGAQC